MRGKQLLKKSMWCLVMGLMFLLNSKQSYAAEGKILHGHTEQCYEKKMIACTDKKEIDVFNQEFWCDTCQRVAAARVVVENYVCHYVTSYREEKRYAYCYSCGNVVHHSVGNGTPVHNRLADVCVCNMTEETVLAQVTLTADKTDWTNENVTLTANVKEMGSSSIAPFTIQFSGGKQDNTKSLVTENGTYTVTVTAANGQSVAVSYEVGNIDKEAPKITKCYVDKQYPEYQSATLWVKGEDSQSQLADNPYSFDGGQTYVSNNAITITKNGIYRICVKDRAGNVSSQSVQVSCFAVKKETEKTETASGSEHTNQKVTETSKTNSLPDNKTKKDSFNNALKEKEKEENISEKSKVYDNLTERLEKNAVSLEKIPGVTSSLMKYNAESISVPTVLYSTKEETKDAILEIESDTQDTNLTDNNRESSKNGLSSVSKWVVAAGVFACIGMSGAVIMLFSKRMG